MHLLVTFQGRALSDFAKRLGTLGSQGRSVMAAALNASGATLREATVAAETAQTGLTHATIDRAQKVAPASPDNLTFVIHSRGGDVRLKYLGARETSGGVTAHPFNHEALFPQAFMKGGRFPNRITISKLNGQVIARKGKARFQTRTVRSGVVIPTEMTTGKTAATFQAGAATIVANAVVTKLGALLP